jgi:ferredoxin--NADP+ reductase
VHAELKTIRVVHDSGVPRFQAGQYFTLGLGNWEPRVAGVDEEHLSASQQRRLCKRAYSASCSILDESDQVRAASDFSYLEFYMVLVRHAVRHPPGLTPRLFALKEGDRLFVSPYATGHYTLGSIEPHCNVFFFATGTGEAPHNAMIADLLTRGHRGKIISVVSVRYLRDAAYRASHEELIRRYSNYWYFVLTTREQRGKEPWTAPLGCHLQDLIVTKALESRSGASLDPTNSQVFLCGNSEMIGAQRGSAASPTNVKPGSMLDLLMERGFRVGQAGQAGNIHFERFW